MKNSPRIRIDDVHVSVRPEEVDSIMGLRHTFDYFEILGNYVSSYLELGWMVKLVIPHLDIALDVDFRQVREVWNQGLTDLAVKGIHTSLMVYTGSASNLMVLEVQGNIAEKALVLGRDWRARCIIEAGKEKEQHFYTWPRVLRVPDITAVETLDIQIFGEGGKISLPPSVKTGKEESIRWLVPPWETPPGAPTPRLLEFLQGHLAEKIEDWETGEDIPSWEEIVTQIASQARLMQNLLTPAADSESYYRTILQEARAVGLVDQGLLLGLLWHAPLGTARHDPQRLPWLQGLIQEIDQEEVQDDPQIQKQLTDIIKELSRTLVDLNKERKAIFKENLPAPCSIPAAPAGTSLEKEFRLITPKVPAPGAGPEEALRRQATTGVRTESPAVCFVYPGAVPQGAIPVNRKQYEAMIYELGRLAALQKHNNQTVREANSLRAKIEAQRQEEINHLRRLVREKKPKKWW